MTNDRASGAIDVVAASRELIVEIAAQPWGQISPSVYETGRLVTLAPWLVGHRRRVEYLLAVQQPDGSWGGPDCYALVPTLSATEALLSTVHRIDAGESPDADQRVGYGALVDAADRGLQILFGWLRGGARLPVPDTPAIEIIVPALVESVNEHLDRWLDAPPKGLERWRGCAGLPLPAGISDAPLATVRLRLESGADVPDKLLHSLEVAGTAVRGFTQVDPTPPGTIGASPAATAAWIAGRDRLDPTDPAVRYLETVVQRLDGPVPSVVPITVFERAWVLSTLIGVGIQVEVPHEIVVCLESSLGPSGTPGGAGLPPDADTTSVVLRTLAQLGNGRAADCLSAYEMDTHFCTWQGERNFSTSVNAHVLEAFGSCGAGGSDRDRVVVDKLASWLCEQQLADGTWVDKWHSSPYYATACCALALHRYGPGSSAPVRRAVNGAVKWILASQRWDGAWGRWCATAEETAYAMQVLLVAGPPTDRAFEPAAARGYRYLLRSVSRLDDVPLWHDKDLYRPAAIVRASVLAALHLAQRNPTVVALATD
jgi:hypothetical protein